MNRRRIVCLSACAALLPHRALVAAMADDRWAIDFEAAQAVGTLAVLDMRDGRRQWHVHDRTRAGRRVSPASTFKIAHALIALQTGVLKDRSEVIAWDGVTRSIPAWNGDQDLASAMRHSAVWVFERFAEQIGLDQEAAWMRTLSYGNARSGGPQPFWVEGELAISALEQIDFLVRLYENALPVARAHQDTVKDVMRLDAGEQWVLRGKTGWSGTIGWWVGWVERAEGPVFFALNIDTPGRMRDLPKREWIVRRALGRLGVLPARAQAVE